MRDAPEQEARLRVPGHDGRAGVPPIEQAVAVVDPKPAGGLGVGRVAGVAVAGEDRADEVVAGIEEASLRALAKLEQVLPARLRHRVGALGAATVALVGPRPTVDAELLTQVAGRAGRGERPGRVLIQTWAPHHYSIRAASDQDYARFIRRELDLRRELFYPPFARLGMVRIEGEEPHAVARVASDVASALNASGAGMDALRILGPAPAPIERIKKRYRWQVMVKSESLAVMRAALGAMRKAVMPRAEREHVHLIVDIDPVRML